MDQLQQLRQLAHQAISDQENLEQRQAGDDMKAAIWALMSLRSRIDGEELEGPAPAYLERLLARLREFQQNYQSDTFNDLYSGARASMGSAINTFAGRAQQMLADSGQHALPGEKTSAQAGTSRRYRWLVLVWLLILLISLLWRR